MKLFYIIFIVFININCSIIETMITQRTLYKRINDVKLITKKNKPEIERDLLQKNPNSLINLLYFPKMEDYTSKILFELIIEINGENKELKFFQYYNKLFLKENETVSFICKISLENWNYLKLVHYQKDLRLINFRTSSNFSDKKLFQQIETVKKTVTKIKIQKKNFKIFPKIDYKREKKIFQFQTNSYLPYIKELDMYYNNTIEFEIENLKMPNFLNKNLKTPSKKYKKISNSKTIMITHDMKNGYKEDNTITLQTPKKGYNYRFENLMEINIFNYFSHHFITIPTLSYIKINHDLGNKILGTIIIEYTSEHYLNLINDLENKKIIFHKLISEMENKGFDGYLLNFESGSKNVKKIVFWVSEFYKAVKKKNENYTIIWYDSLTKNGYVNWQGGINEENSAFTKISDFFFLDYRWSLKKIQKSKTFVDKENQVMAGIDVWGRSTKYGGFETEKEIDILKDDPKISIDIFAPAYSYEQNGGFDLLENFDINQRKLWEGYEAKLLFDQIDLGNDEPFFVDFNEVLAKSESFEYFFGFDFKGNEKVGYFAFLTFFGENEVLGCLDTFRRKFVENSNYCVFQDKEDFYRYLKVEKYNEKLILEKSDFYSMKEKITKIQFNLIFTCENEKGEKKEKCETSNFSFFQIGELRQKNKPLIKDLLLKKIVNLPINTFFSEGEGNNFFINGKNTEFQNYNYLLDYDINIDLIQNSLILEEKFFDKPLENYIIKIDKENSFFGTSSLKLSGLIKKNIYLSHSFYNLQIPQNNFYIKSCYKINKLYNTNLNYQFKLINNQKYFIKPNTLITQKKNNWICETRFYKTKITNAYFILFIESKKNFIIQENFFDINIGQISIYEDNSLLTFEISEEFLTVNFKARKNLLENYFDLYLNLVINDFSLDLKKCFLMRNGNFVRMLYFEEFVVKKLDLRKGLHFELFCISESGKFLPVKQHVVVDYIEEFNFDNE